MSKTLELAQARPSILESIGIRGGSTPEKRGVDIAPTPPHLVGFKTKKNVARVNLDRIVVDADQPRKEFDDESLQLLANSIKERGQIQPVTVYWSGGVGKYVLVCGERRYRAAVLAGLDALDCSVLASPPSAVEAREIQLIENILREDLKPIEQAVVYRELMEIYQCSARELERRINVSHKAISRSLGLLSLPESVRDDVNHGRIAPTTAYEISRVADETIQVEVAQTIISKAVVGKQAVELVKRAKAATRPKTAASPRPDLQPPAPDVVATTWATVIDGYEVRVFRAAGVTPSDAARVLRLAVEQIEKA